MPVNGAALNNSGMISISGSAEADDATATTGMLNSRAISIVVPTNGRSWTWRISMLFLFTKLLIKLLFKSF